MDVDKIRQQAAACMETLLEAAHLEPGSLIVIGCSTSEVIGKKIGSESTPQAAEAIFQGVYPLVESHQLRLAAQCCEHLNRALVVEKETADKFGFEPVTVIPVNNAGGSWATHVYSQFKHPVVVETLDGHPARAGIDIGETCIGMHLQPVAVMVRMAEPYIGEARVTMVRTRPKLIGGARAKYE